MAREAAVRALLVRATKAGLVGGGVIVYVSIVGLLQALEERDFIYPILTLAPALILLINILSGYAASRPLRVRPGEPEPPPPPLGHGLLAGMVGGLVSGALPAFLLVIGDAINLREVLVAVNPTLLEILAWSQGVAVGALILVGVGALLGLIGGAVHLLSARDRRPFMVGLTAVAIASMASSVVEEVLDNFGDQLADFGDNIGLNLNLVFFDNTNWLYVSDGLSIEPPFFAAVVIFLIAFGITFWRARTPEAAGERPRRTSAEQREVLKWVGRVLLAVFLFVVPYLVGSSHTNTLLTVGIYVLLGLGLNIVVGYAGLLDLGYVAFFAIGAYATAVLISPDSFLASGGEGFTNFWIALPLVVIISTISGLLIGAPVLRLRGDYLAIVTLGFGEIVRILVQAPAFKTWTGGSQGITQVPEPRIAEGVPVFGGFAFDSVETLYYLILVCVIAFIFISYRLQDSRIGRSWIAMREDEQVAEAMGISIIKTKLLAFAMGAAVGSFSGMFISVQIGSVFPQSLTIIVSVTVLALLVLGGMGSIPGVIIGSFVLVGLPELLREFDEFRLHLYGGILVAIMILRPEGLIPSARRRLELHEEEEEQLQYERRHAEDVEPGAPVVVAAQPKDMT
ncbi:MAG: branched-chain amino acid ABC transporter permease [Actinomycetota bacterium]